MDSKSQIHQIVKHVGKLDDKLAELTKKRFTVQVSIILFAMARRPFSNCLSDSLHGSFISSH